MSQWPEGWEVLLEHAVAQLEPVAQSTIREALSSIRLRDDAAAGNLDTLAGILETLPTIIQEHIISTIGSTWQSICDELGLTDGQAHLLLDEVSRRLDQCQPAYTGPLSDS